MENLAPRSLMSLTREPPSLPRTWGLALGLLAGWLATGSCGVLTLSLQALLVWGLLIIAAVLIRPRLEGRGLAVAGVTLALLLLTPRAMGWSPFHLPLAVVAVLGLLGMGERGTMRRILLAAGLAVLAVTLLHFAQRQIPAAWLVSDQLGQQLGRLTSWITGQPVRIGATFAGLDFLVAMGVFWLGTLRLTRPRKLNSTLFAVAVILLAHVAYLATLAVTPRITDALPPAVEATFTDPYVPPDFCWSTVARQLLPWNLLAWGAMLHALVAVLIVRWMPWEAETEKTLSGGTPPRQREMTVIAIPVILAFLLPLIGSLNLASSLLDGKKIVANVQENIDYDVPQHGSYGQQSAGMFGMLRAFVESLGGEFQTISRLSSPQLQDADVLLLLHPDTTFTQKHLVWEYASNGGSVLIVAGGFNPELGLGRASNELLAGAAISVSQDAAVSETGNWQNSYQSSLHPATSRADMPSTRFLSDYGASLQISWGARPLVTGQWGWSAPQQGATWSESQPLRTGARLGDLVLAAEQRIGDGTVAVLGGNAPLTNEGLVTGYEFTGELLAYLAHHHTGSQSPWRQAAGVLCCLGIFLVLVRRPSPGCLIGVGLILTVGFGATSGLSRYASRVIPHGEAADRPATSDVPGRVAYIDQSHLEAYDFEDWGYDAIEGLTLNLMRNGYLPLTLPRLTAERLEGAELFVTIGPSKEFSVRERSVLKSFVDKGGTLVCTVGGEDAAASASLLAEFGLNVPRSPVPTGGDWPEPEPFGRTRAFYLNVEEPDGGSYQAVVRLHSAWPVELTHGEGTVIAYGRNESRVTKSDTQSPVILAQPFGRGTVVLIGDTDFAMNKNMEYIGGEPLQGGYENAYFWRWLVSWLTEQPEWVPPRPKKSKSATSTEDDS